MPRGFFERFSALVEKQILDEKGNIIIRSTEKKADLSHEVRNMIGSPMKVLPQGAVAGTEMRGYKCIVYDLRTFENGGIDIPVVERVDFNSTSA